MAATMNYLGFFLLLYILSVGCVVYHDCPIPGAANITIGGPLSMSAGIYSNYGSFMLNAALLFQEWINYERSPRGIQIGGNPYCLRLYFEEDYSSASEVAAIVSNMTQAGSVDFFLAPFSSSLTAIALDITDPAKYIMLASGASVESLFLNHEYGYSTLPPAANVYEPIIDALRFKGVESIAYLHEDATFPNDSCKAIDGIIDDIGDSALILKGGFSTSYSPSYAEVDEAIKDMAALGEIDLVIVCAYENTCISVTQSMKNNSLEPNALVMSLCPTLPSFLSTVGIDAKHMMSHSIWSDQLELIDKVTGWSVDTFIANYSAKFGIEPSGHASSQFAALESLITAIEEADSIETDVVGPKVGTISIDSILGRITFTNNNMNDAKSMFLQVNDELKLQIAVPAELATDDYIYPMESWSTRECYEEFGEESCLCNEIECTQCGIYTRNATYDRECIDGQHKITYSYPAHCIEAAYGTYTYDWESCRYISLDSPLGIALIVICVLVSLLGVACGVWILLHRNDPIIRASQAKFLVCICAGYVVLSLDSLTFVGSPNVNMCITRFSALSFGFTLMFGTLLVLVYRVWKIFACDSGFSKIVLREANAYLALGGMLMIDLLFMIIWLTYMEPSIVNYHSQNESCLASENFFGLIALYKVIQLATGCFLSYETRHVDKIFMQSDLIGGAVFMLSILWFIFIAFVMSDINEKASSVVCIFTLLSSCVIGLGFVVVPKILMQKSVKSVDTRDSTKNPRRTMAKLSKKMSVRIGLRESEMDDSKNYGLYRLSCKTVCSLNKEECIELLARSLEKQYILQEINDKLKKFKSENEEFRSELDSRQPILSRAGSGLEMLKPGFH